MYYKIFADPEGLPFIFGIKEKKEQCRTNYKSGDPDLFGEEAIGGISAIGCGG
jgi:hypothetical protein